MQGDDPEFLEAVRLAQKFFPESKGYISNKTGLDWEAFCLAMVTADYHGDYSCDLFQTPPGPDLGLARKGGLEGNDEDVYQRLLEHTGISPQGRAVIVFDAIGSSDWHHGGLPPIVCHSRTIPERLAEQPCFHQNNNVIFIYESGEAILIDHDNRVYWARSRMQ